MDKETTRISFKIGEEIITPTEVVMYPNDYDWDGRNSIHISLEMTAAKAAELFQGNMQWSRIEPGVVYAYKEDGTIDTDESGNPKIQSNYTETDMSEYSIIGDIVDHRDGSIQVNMGKPTDFEKMIEMMFGGE